jgi:hypothetical protein
MSIDTRTEAERRYDAERTGTLYFPEPTEREILTAIIDLAPATEEDADYNPWDDIIDVLAGVEHQPFGTLPDGTPIPGQFDLRAPKRWGVVHAKLAGWSFCVDDSGHIGGSSAGEEPSIDFDSATIEQLRELAALVNAGVFDRLLAAAVAWGRGDAEPPAIDDPTQDIPLSADEEAILDLLDKQGAPLRRA